MDVHRCRFVDYTPPTISSSCFDNAGNLYIGRSNGQIEMWDPEGWVHRTTIPGAKGTSCEGMVWADGRLFSIGGSTYITEWDLDTLRPRVNYDCNAGVIWCIDTNPSETQLSVGCDDGSVVIVDIAGGVIEHNSVGQRQDQRVMCLKWCGDDLIAGGCADGRIRVWQVAKGSRGRIVTTMRVDKSKTESTLVWSLCYLPQRKQVVSGDSTGSVKFWDVARGALLQSFAIHEADVLALAVDHSGEKLFSAGVDRKIHQFSLLSKNKSTRWVHSFNRLLHANDVRTLALHGDVLVSGGVERSIVAQSVSQFSDGEYKKMTVDQQLSQIVICGDVVGLFADQTVKLWRVDGAQAKLVAKVVIRDDENITSIAISPERLVVATINSLKVFTLTSGPSKIAISKIRDPEFDAVATGAKHVCLLGHKLMVVTPEEEIYRFTIDDTRVKLDDEVETPGSTVTSTRVEVAPNGEHFALVRADGDIEVYPVEGAGKRLTKVTKANAITWTAADRLAVVSSDNSICELFIEGAHLLTPWSKGHSAPTRFAALARDSTVQGAFVTDDKLWVYGMTWLAYFDMSMPASPKSKKRTRNGSLVDEDPEPSPTQFGVTDKYRPIIKASAAPGSALMVIERPLFSLPSTSAFFLPKIQL
ncbi:U3 small nucleolar RNA-associated protein 4 [Diutina catenulata]